MSSVKNNERRKREGKFNLMRCCCCWSWLFSYAEFHFRFDETPALEQNKFEFTLRQTEKLIERGAQGKTQ